MHAQPHIRGKQAPHAAIAQHPTHTFLAYEDVRERMSVHKCDKRRHLSASKAHFPGVDFSLVNTEEDVLWGQRHAQVVGDDAQGDRFVVAEAPAAVAARGSRALQWLLQRYVCTSALFVRNM